MPIDNREKEITFSEKKEREFDFNRNSEHKENLEVSREGVNFEDDQNSDLKERQEDLNIGESQSANIYSVSNDPAVQVYKQIEKILEEDLADLYNSLNYKQKMIFKAKGEETAKSIFQLIYKKSKIKVKKIIKLVRNWLKLIPGVNKFFLEQEAKIKADKIIYLVENDKKIQF